MCRAKMRMASQMMASQMLPNSPRSQGETMEWKAEKEMSLHLLLLLLLRAIKEKMMFRSGDLQSHQ